ncbi:MAG: DUF86 domain-containing protein [Candidatus Thorarchaeota archaeon]|nr:DUF86 domain-containing protein [Candidatus Thorarchaeota archaeon]
MDEVRRARYYDKMQYITENLQDCSVLVHRSGKYDEKALYYSLMTAIESAMDVMAMMLKDSGLVPKGDKYNIDRLAEKGIISSELAAELVLSNNLRNILAHRYNGIDRLLVLRSFERVDSALQSLVKIVEGWLVGH